MCGDGAFRFFRYYMKKIAQAEVIERGVVLQSKINYHIILWYNIWYLIPVQHGVDYAKCEKDYG